MLVRPLIAALVLFAQPSLAQTGAFFSAGPANEEVFVEADNIFYSGEGRTLRLEGHVVATRGAGVLRASRGVLDRKANTLLLQGSVLGVQGREVFLADSALVDLTARSADLEHAVLFLKDRAAAARLSGGIERAAARGAGKNALTLTGSRVRRLEGGKILAENVSMTPCDCAGEPDYEITSPSVLIDGDRAHLSSPHLHLLGANLPLLIPISLPLTDRQSGLLFPPLSFLPITGFGTALPIFLTLGRSWDLTLSPGYSAGTSPTQSKADFFAPIDSSIVYDTNQFARTVRGPRLGTELRYAPVEGTRGSLQLDLFYDQDRRESPAVPGAYGEADTGAGRGFGGLRGVAHLSHRTDVGATAFAIQGTVASDAMAVWDTEPGQLERALDTLRTDLGLWRQSGPLTLGADATLLQDIHLANFAAPDRRLFGDERRATFQRLPALFVQLAPEQLFESPVELLGEASLVRYQPLAAIDPQERLTGFGPTDRVSSGAPPPLGFDAARGKVVRLDLSPRLSLPLLPSLPFSTRLEAGVRADAWRFDDHPERNRQRLYGLAELRTSAVLEKSYGSYLHTITPSAELRAISRPLSSGGAPIGDEADAGGPTYAASAGSAQQGVYPGDPGYTVRDGSPTAPGVPALRRAYDELDGSASSTGALQGTLGVSQSLWQRGSKGHAPGRIVRFDLLQDLLFATQGGRARVGEGSLLTTLPIPFGSASFQARYDWSARQVTALVGSFGIRDPRSDELHGSFAVLRRGGTERLRAGVDELFATALLSTDPGSLTGTAGGGASVAVPIARQGLRLGYDLAHYLGVAAPQASFIHAFSLGYDTPCHCAGFQVGLALHAGNGVPAQPIFHFVLDLKSLGSFASF